MVIFGTFYLFLVILVTLGEDPFEYWLNHQTQADGGIVWHCEYCLGSNLKAFPSFSLFLFNVVIGECGDGVCHDYEMCNCIQDCPGCST